ncbi:MAG: Methyltransferase type 11 [Gemmatimonadetes bacterium]|nr:Methyltransferase type 11 [Gemmatimonadota bacterium]
MPGPPIGPAGLLEWFGGIDVYLFDQLLKGRLAPGMEVLDAGCGAGRNLVYLLRAGFRVAAVDADVDAVARVRALAAELAPSLDAGRFRVAAVEALPFSDAAFDFVISSAVLHFARDEAHFRAMLGEMWRVLRPGRVLWARLASDVAIEQAVRPLGGRRFVLPDGSERFLVDERMLRAAEAELDARPLDPLRTTLVHGRRSMTTWCIRKPAG